MFIFLFFRIVYFVFVTVNNRKTIVTHITCFTHINPLSIIFFKTLFLNSFPDVRQRRGENSVCIYMYCATTSFLKGIYRKTLSKRPLYKVLIFPMFYCNRKEKLSMFCTVFNYIKYVETPPYIKFDWWEILKNGDCREEVLATVSLK